MSVLGGRRVDQDAVPETSWDQTRMINSGGSMAKCRENPRPRTLERKSQLEDEDREAKASVFLGAPLAREVFALQFRGGVERVPDETAILRAGARRDLHGVQIDQRHAPLII